MKNNSISKFMLFKYLKFILNLFIFIIFICKSYGQEVSIFRRPENLIPDVAATGYINKYYFIDPSGEHKEFPLLVGFTSKAEMGLLGPHWTIPALESRVVKVNENRIQAILPGGRVIDLYRDRINQNIFEEKGAGWRGAIDPRDSSTFELMSPDQYRIVFKKGQIRSVSKSDSKETLWNWSRDENNSIKITEANGSILIAVKIGDKGLVDSLSIGKKTFNVIYKFDPEILTYEMNQIMNQDNTGIISNLNRSGEAEEASQSYMFFGKTVRDMTIRTKSGIVDSINDVKYLYKGDKTSYSIRTEFGNYWRENGFDTTKGTEFYNDSYGKGYKIFRFAGNALNAGKIRKIEATQNGKIKNTFELYWSSTGLPVRYISNGKVVKGPNINVGSKNLIEGCPTPIVVSDKLQEEKISRALILLLKNNNNINN